MKMAKRPEKLKSKSLRKAEETEGVERRAEKTEDEAEEIILPDANAPTRLLVLKRKEGS